MPDYSHISATFLSDAEGGVTGHVFVDDAILIQKYYLVGDSTIPQATIAVSVNANPRGNEGKLRHWMEFDVDWYGA